MSTLAVAVVGALLALSVPGAAQAAGVVSQGNGRLLTAFLGGSSIDSLVALNGADAVNPFGLGNVTSDVPLDATALSALNLAVSGVNLFGSPGIIQLGAVGQYGGANNDASSVAFSGTVSQAPSLVGVGTTVTGSNVGTPGAGDSATINVGTTQILGGANLVQLGVDVGAVAASASQTAGGLQSGNYVISNLNVVVGGTVLGSTVTGLNTLLTPTLTAVNALVAPAIVNPLAGGQVTITLTDLLAVAGVANVNALPAGTNLLSYLPAAVTAKVTSIVNNLLASLQTAVTGLGLAGLAAQALLTTAQTAITPILTGLTGTLNGPLGTAVNALLQLDVNNQSTVAGAFTQNALTIGVGASGGLARVGLANATVGPNAGVSGVTPVITGITPNTGPTAGGTAVTITGTGLTGSTGVTFGGLPATSVVVVNDTTITAVSPAHAAGAVNVVVQNPAANSAPGTFTYVPPATITNITPVTGPTAGGTAVTITGTGFTGSTGVNFGGLPATSVVVVNDTTITALSPAHAAGLVNVVVQNPVGNSGPFGFTYVAPAVITGIAPNTGPTAGGTAVTISGTGFTGSTGVAFGGTAATSVVVVNDTTITAVSPAHAAGPVNVVVQNPGGNSGPLGFTYVPPAAITGITPNTGPESGGTSVIISGTGFTGSTGVTFGGVAATGVVVVNDTTITAVSPAHAPGPVNVSVQNPAGNSGSVGFTYTPLVSIGGVSPNSGPTAGGTSVTITGTCFTGATGATFGGVAGTAFTVVDDSHITVTSPAHAAGAVDVVVNGSVACGGTTTLANGFTYIAPNGPVVVSLTPTSGPASGGTTVTISGTNLGGATGVTFDGTGGTNFTSVNGTTITVSTPPHAAGTVNVVVQTPLGPSAPLAFTYLPTTVTGVDPGTGPEVGDTSVVVTGTCFTGATGVLFGATPAASFQVVSDTEIIAVSPSGAGTVDVTVVGSANCSNGTLASAFRYVAAGLALTGTGSLAPALIVSLLLLLTGAGIMLVRRRRNLMAD